MLKTAPEELCPGSNFMRCGLCGGTNHSFKMLPAERVSDKGRDDSDGSDLRKKVTSVHIIFHNSYVRLSSMYISFIA